MIRELETAFYRTFDVSRRLAIFNGNSKSSEVDLSLKTKGWCIVLFLFGGIFINYFILPYVRTCRYIDFGILGGFTTSILLSSIFHIVLISLFIKKRLISIPWILFVWGTIVLFIRQTMIIMLSTK